MRIAIDNQGSRAKAGKEIQKKQIRNGLQSQGISCKSEMSVGWSAYFEIRPS